jgi:ribonuclease G
MSRNTLVINCDLRETRVCLIEDGVIAELHLERSLHRGTVGNIVLGRVTRVLPGMQAAFIDIGMERAAFLHVEDLIRPADFEAYLDKGDRREEEPSGKGDGNRRFGTGTATADDETADDETADDETADDETADDETADDEEDDDPDSAEDWSDDKDEHLESARVAIDDVEPSSDPEPLHSDAISLETADDETADEDSGEVELDETNDDLADSEDDLVTDEGDDETSSDESDDETADESEDVGASDDDQDAGFKSEHLALSRTDDPALETDPDSRREGDDDDVCDDESSEPPNNGSDIVQSSDVSDAGDVLPPQAIADPRQRDGRGRRRRRRRRRNGDPIGQPVSAGQAVSPPSLPQKVVPAKPNVDAPRAGASTARQSVNKSAARHRGRDNSSRDNSSRDNSSRDNSSRDNSSRDNSSRDNSSRKIPLSRVSRSVPITEIVKEGNEVVVQISKEPIGTKGARVTSHVSLPGRHVVYLPTVDHIGISKRIGSTKERNRLRQVIDALKPQNGGLIVRTVAEGLTKKSLKTDIGYLIALWKEVSRKKASAKAPTVLYTELDLVLKTARDLFTDDVEKIIIDDKEQYGRLVQFVEMFSPSRVKDIELYTGDEPIFDAYGIEDEIGRALGRKVPLPSGGYLVIDQAEALTAIDVNTGRFVGKGSKDLEETALKTNLEAVTEIAYQLRLRNIGGLVILDLIDMDYASNRDKVWRALEQHLAKDKAKTTINRISDLGLIEMTRKRTRESLTRMLHEPCFYCDGTGQIQSRVTVAYEILRQVRRERHLLKGYSIIVNAHPAVIDLLQNEEKGAVQETERRYMRRLDLVPRREYHLEQFDLQGR